MADWVRDAIWWQVYPLGFVDAPATLDDPGAQHVTRRLPKLLPWLDYAVQLGANGLALQPVFASQSHGYDTVDYYRVDPRLGTEDDLLTLFRAARDKGIRILLDGVFNHVGTGHPAFADVVAKGPDSQTASWFKLRFPDGWKPGQAPEYDAFEGHSRLVELNHESPDVVAMVTDVMCHWLEKGADGWRLDAAYAVTPTFWAKVLPAVRERHPDAYIVGEVIHGDYAGIVAESGMDAVTQYELWKAIWSSLASANFWELDHALGRHNTFLDAFVPMTFIGNHDVTRVTSQLGDERLIPIALCVLMTVGGTPSIYYGDEQGFTGVKEERLGGDDAIRPEFPTDPSGLDLAGWNVYRVHQELIGLRRRNRWLHTARTTTTQLSNTVMVYQTVAEDSRLVVALNCSDQPATAAVENVGQVLSGPGTLAGGTVTLPAFGWVVLA